MLEFSDFYGIYFVCEVLKFYKYFDLCGFFFKMSVPVVLELPRLPYVFMEKLGLHMDILNLKWM